MIDLLKPIFQGELAPMGEALECVAVPPSGALHIHDLLAEPDRLEQVIRRYAHCRKAPPRELRAVASVWAMEYLARLLPPVTAAATLLDHVFPVQPEHVWVSLDHSGMADRFHILDLGQAQPGATTSLRYEAMLWLHLDPLFRSLSAITGLPQKILWASAARYFAMLLDHAVELTRRDPKVLADRDALLRQRLWAANPHDAPGPRANPLVGAQRKPHDQNAAMPAVHPLCCLAYRLPDSHYCTGCPLVLKAQAKAA